MWVSYRKGWKHRAIQGPGFVLDFEACLHRRVGCPDFAYIDFAQFGFAQIFLSDRFAVFGRMFYWPRQALVPRVRSGGGLFVGFPHMGFPHLGCSHMACSHMACSHLDY